MRILSVTAQKPDSTGSGVYLTELVKELDRLGHKQAVIGGIYECDQVNFPENVDFYPAYFRTKELPFAITGMSDEMPYDSTRYSDMTDEMTDQFVNTFRGIIRRVLKEFRPEVIICHHLYFLGSMVRELCPNTRVYGICHGSDLRQVKKNPWQWEYIKEQICRFDGIFALHEEQKEQICQFYGCERYKVQVIGTGYNSDIFYVNEEIKAAKDNGKHRYIFAGKISEKKGVKSLLRALQYIKEPEKTELVLAGGYSTLEELEACKRLAEKASCKVEFLGRLPQKKLAEELNRSDVFVLPSFFEGLPLVNIEAMACGLRVVCTDLPGIQPWMEAKIPENGAIFVTPPRMINEDEPLKEELPAFEKAFANAMEEALERPVVSREKIEQVSWRGLAKWLIEKIDK